MRGALWMLASAFGFSCMAALVKVAGETLPAAQVAFFRCVFGLLFLAPAILHAGLRTSFATTKPGLHLARSAFGVTAMFCFFIASANAPLADVTALTFAKPLFVIVIATLFLGEIVRWRRWTATAVGFLGVVVMIRPGGVGFDPDPLYALAGAALVAAVAGLVKQLAKTDSLLTTMAWFAAISTLATLGPALAVWVPPSPMLWGVCALIGLVGVASQSAIVAAYRSGEATAVAPFDYSRILFATALGIFLFGEWPDAWALRRNYVWSWYIAHDRYHDAEPMKCLTVEDEATGFCLAIHTARRIQSTDIKALLRQLIVRFGRPRAIRCDNGSELVATVLREELKRQHIQLANIDPGKPWQNGCNESFNGTFRRECLNAEIFGSLMEARVVI